MVQTNRLRPIEEGQLPPEYIAYSGEPQPAPPPPEYSRAPQAPVGPPQAPPAPRPRAEAATTSVLLMALKAVSQRTLIAVSQLFTLATAGSAFWLWFVTLPAPSILQLVGLGLYGLLILALNWLVLRRR